MNKFFKTIPLIFNLLICFSLCGEEDSKDSSYSLTSNPLAGEENKAQTEKTDSDYSLTSKPLVHQNGATENNSKENPSQKNQPEKKEETKDDKKEEPKEETKPKEEPPKIGNFSLPASQQPAALFGLGGNIIDVGEVQLYFFADEFIGRKKSAITLLPSVLFGVTENFSLYFNFPSTPLLRDGRNRSGGIEDCFIQFEYAFYNKSTYAYDDQATLVANIATPTGSIKKMPQTGFGAPSFFIGATYYRTMVNWVFFTAQGAVLTTSDHKTKIGDQFLYQFGMSRNFPSPEGTIYSAMLEIDGQFGRRNRFFGHLDKNSGGNFVYVTPSLWISTKKETCQFGISFPINQNLFGRQRKFDYALNFNYSRSFY